MPRASPTLAAALIAVAIAGCGAGSRDRSGGPRPEHPVVLTMANALQGPADIGQFADAVARISHGSLRIHIINDWRHGDPRFERRLVGDVRAGDADLGWVGSRGWARPRGGGVAAPHRPPP